MAGRRRASGSGVVAVCLLLVSLVACGGRPATDAARDSVQRVLDRRAEAIVEHDESAFVRTGVQSGYDELNAVPFAEWSYRVTGVRRAGDSATADVELSYRIKGHDRAPVTAGRTVRLSLDAAGEWYVESERPAEKAPEQLWDQGRVEVVRGERGIVLGVGQPAGRLRTFAELADRAVPAVTRAWGTEWPRGTVILVPESLEGMAGLLGSPASSYRGIAAVTTGETGAPAPADRIILNPVAYGVLGQSGKQVVLTHETTHVATRAHTSAATPLWLSEGYADWVGYLGSGRTPSDAAPELWRAVTEGEIPAGLPTDEDFGFTGDSAGLAQAYESGWMACRMIADRWGEVRLGEFYRAVGAHEKRPGAVEEAMEKVLDTTVEDFTAQWREYLRGQFA
ncbi:hypothetical protein STRCI_002352 [Streptomyces cinnabarinus]|uniref:Lipoprotein n=1 Tax=Streptomyces cinnabarinus TaxID=67287 RepID=A0ABY7KCW6_9ACTN|nr:hypothetical protein [Streptomyces cinnabarinus]WAZ21192.1 hypothetical protein STRCI_002352 [Streptomyces cinnabarinus]